MEANIIMNTPELVLYILERADLTTCLRLLVNRTAAAVWAANRYQILSSCALLYRYTIVPLSPLQPTYTYSREGRIEDMWDHVLAVIKAMTEGARSVHVSTPISSISWSLLSSVGGDDDAAADAANGIVCAADGATVVAAANAGQRICTQLKLTKVDPFNHVEVTMYLCCCSDLIGKVLTRPPLSVMDILLYRWRAASYAAGGLQLMGNDLADGTGIGYFCSTLTEDQRYTVGGTLSHYMLATGAEAPHFVIT